MTRSVSESEASAGTRAAGGPGDTLATSSCSQRDLCHYFLRLRALGFGGPIAVVGYMQGDLVERRRWISKVKEVPEPLVILGAGVLGFIVRGYYS